MTIGITDATARVAAIQQMAASLAGGTVSGGVGIDGGGFSQALQAADAAGGATRVSSVTGGGAVSGVAYSAEINTAATKYGVDPSLLAGLVKQESGFNPSATSGAGARGLTQLMPATARALGVTDPTDPAQALDGGAKYLRQMLDRFGGDERLALAAYNAGPGAVARFGGVPPYGETQAYVKNVLANRDAFAASGLGAAGAATTVPVSLSTGATAGSTLGSAATTGAVSLDTSSSSSVGPSSYALGYPTT